MQLAEGDRPITAIVHSDSAQFGAFLKDLAALMADRGVVLAATG